MTTQTEVSTPRMTSKNAKAVCLVSGGIDSPVAAWLIARSGVQPVFVYFDSRPLVSDQAKSIALETIRKVRQRLANPARVYVIPHGDDLAQISTRCPINLACIISRRLMLRIAREVARKEGADAIVLGDSLGQKASQTAQNLQVTDSAVQDLPILRPLIGLNKMDMERYAREIGTFELSISPGVASCGVPARSPRTHGRFDEIYEAESALDLDGMIKRALEQSEILEV